MCPRKGECCVQISTLATDNLTLNCACEFNFISCLWNGAKNCQILNQLQIQLLITYRHDMTYNATFYQSLQILFILSMIFPHLCILNVWTNIDLISCLISDFIPKRQVP